MENTSLKKWHLPFLILLLVGTVFIIGKHQKKEAPFQKDEGVIFGTTYHTTYQFDRDLHDEIMETLQQVDNSLSMFNQQSTLSRINANESSDTDSLLEEVFTLAQRISEETNGAFDVTVAPLVHAWGFGFKHDALPDSAQVDSLRQLIGWKHVSLENHQIKKDIPGVVMDFSAIAKGFGSDQVAKLFQQYGIQNYMVEIGGEVVTGGTNPKCELWRIGINKPETDSTLMDNKIEQVIQMDDCAMATSGNYRNFYYKDGRRIAHTIDPHTGYPVQHNILSSTVIAPTCAEADGFATSFMVLGLENAQEILSNNPQLKAYFIYTDENDEYQIWYSPSLKNNLAQ